MTNWPRYGVLAATYAAQVRRSAPGVPVVVGTGKVFATYAAELVAARQAAQVEDIRLTNEPRWMAERGQSFQSHGPQWTGESRPGRYP